MRENINDARRREHERDLQRLRDLRPIDDDFMRQLVKDNTPLAEMVLRIITGKQDLTLLFSLRLNSKWTGDTSPATATPSGFAKIATRFPGAKPARKRTLGPRPRGVHAAAVD